MVNALPCWTPRRPSLLLRLRVEAWRRRTSMREVDNKPLVQPPLVHYLSVSSILRLTVLLIVSQRVQPFSALRLRGWFARLTPP
jgi:hypothetical protein